MKRLAIVFVALTVLAAPSIVSAQKADLSGSWVLDVEKSATKEGPQAVIITVTDKEFSARLGGEQARLTTFQLDGRETTMPDGSKLRAAWKQNKLEATVTTEARGADTMVFSREGEWLVVEGKSMDRSMKFYFRKAK